MAEPPSGGRTTGAAAPEDLAWSLRNGPDQPTLRRVMEKSIAVGSGKGGVGKTITAANLAIHYARKGLRVGLADLDPLSDVASLLDLYESEQALQGAGRRDAPVGRRSLQEYVLPAFRGLEILFPMQKLGAGESGRVMEMIYRVYLSEIDRRYDLLLFDMPAGLGYAENLAFIPFMRQVILVTNPEPTAHASAGAYARELLRLYPGTRIRIWHNRYVSRPREGFHPRDVAGNYNRVVDSSEMLTPKEAAMMEDFAFVPEDPALDLLQGEPDPSIHVLRCMRDGMSYAHVRLIAHAARKLGIPSRIRDIVVSYVHRNPKVEGVEEYLGELGDYLHETIVGMTRGARGGVGAAQLARGLATFSPAERSALEGLLAQVKQSALRRELLRMEDLLASQVNALEESRGPFAGRVAPTHNRALDREMAQLLVVMNRAASQSVLMRNQGILLLFYFSLHKLFQSKTLVNVLRGLIPRRTNRKGRKVRDRFRQIRILVEQDPAYRERYLKGLRSLHALVTRQLAAVAKAFDLQNILLRDSASAIDDRSYLKLLAAFLHETLYAGLSVIVSFDYRSAAAAFQEGADRLLALMGQGSAPEKTAAPRR